jgi:hypothetical protein
MYLQKVKIGVLKVKDKNSGIPIHCSEAQILIRTKMSRIHNS